MGCREAVSPGSVASASSPTFYQMLQMGVADLKRRMKEAGSRGERARTAAALVVRDLLVVLFAVLYVSLFTALFGPVASAPAVATFVMLICLRFVAFGYAPWDNLKVLGVLFAVFATAPLLVSTASPAVRLLVNVVCLGTVMALAVDDPRMGTGGMYGFAYCFVTGSLYGQPLSGDVLASWIGATALGFAVCAAVYWKNRFACVSEKRLADALRSRCLRSRETAYRLRVAVGVSLALFAGDVLGLPRLMWVGLVASSMLTPYGLRVVDRLGTRVLFVALGTGLFLLAYGLVPPEFQGLIAIAAGLGTGLCATYRWSQVFNTVGAMTLGVTCCGLEVASVARVGDNLVGAVFALLVSAAFAGLASLSSRKGDRGEAA